MGSQCAVTETACHGWEATSRPEPTLEKLKQASNGLSMCRSLESIFLLPKASSLDTDGELNQSPPGPTGCPSQLPASFPPLSHFPPFPQATLPGPASLPPTLLAQATLGFTHSGTLLWEPLLSLVLLFLGAGVLSLPSESLPRFWLSLAPGTLL